MKFLSLLTGLILPSSVLSNAILGIDLGSFYMKVALVQRNSPLEIVTNLHSKRRTEQMVLFDQGARFYGADASSLIARKPMFTPEGMSVMLGRSDDHPAVQALADKFYPIKPVYNETRSGICLTVNGNSYTPEELVAMVLVHAKDMTAAYGATTQIKDCVLTVPSFYTQHERRAVLDAMSLAGLNTLALIDETTAAGLHFGIDRIDEVPHNVLFYNMGASALQVTIIQYHSYDRKESRLAKAKKVGAFQVLGRAWDSTLGGQTFDARLVNHMAMEFNDMWNKKRNDGEKKDIRSLPRPMAKLRIQANKIKQVLSANADVPVFVDSLYDDMNYQSHISRSLFEGMCDDLLKRSGDPIHDALKAANMTLDDIHAVELVGGGMRVPKVQDMIKEVLGGKHELGMHINSDESMALGAAFHGANVSTAFRVRHVGMTDITPFPISVSLEDLPEEAKSTGLFGLRKEEPVVENEEGPWSKKATIFKANGKIGVRKTITFTHDHDVACSLSYVESDILPIGTQLDIERYNITGVSEFAKEMEEKGLSQPKVSLQFELSTSGISKLVKAEAIVEEMVNVTEEIEVDDDDQDSEEQEEVPIIVAEGEKEAETNTKEESKENEKEEDKVGSSEETVNENDTKAGEAQEASAEGVEANSNTTEKEENATTSEKKQKEKPKKKKKMIKVEKEKKKFHKRTLSVTVYHTGRLRPYSDEIKVESLAKLDELTRIDNERIALEESRNKFEAYIYHIKNKLIDDEEVISTVSTEEQRIAILALANEAEEWMYEDGYDADRATFEDKYAELSDPAEKIFFRVSEAVDRPAAVEKLLKKLIKVENLMKKWETTMLQVTEEERADVLVMAGEIKKSVETMQAGQDLLLASDPDLFFTSAEVPIMSKVLEGKIGRLSRRPKPKEKKEEKKNETETNEDESKAEKEGDEPNNADEVNDDEEKSSESEGGEKEKIIEEGKEEETEEANEEKENTDENKGSENDETDSVVEPDEL